MGTWSARGPRRAGDHPHGGVLSVRPELPHGLVQRADLPARLHPGQRARSGRALPAPAGVSYLSCPTTSFCAAAPSLNQVALYNGTSWGAPTTIESAQGFTAVDCTGPSFCITIDGEGNSFALRGGSWSGNLGAWGAANQISCVSPTFCVAAEGGPSVWDGSRWTQPGDADSGGQLNAVSCATTTFCVLVDSSGAVLTWNGTAFSAPQSIAGEPAVTGTNAAGLTGVSCPTTTFCRAVDSVGRVFGWNGSTWSPGATIDHGHGLTAISCPTTTYCVAVDRAGNAFISGSTRHQALSSGASPRPMTQARSWAGSVRWLEAGQLAGQPLLHQRRRQRHHPDAEVAVVHGHLPPTREHAVPRVLDDAARGARGRVPGLVGQLGHDPRHRVGTRDDVGHQRGGRAGGPGLDVGAALLETTGILVAQLTPGRTLEAPHHAVAVAGDVGEQVADAPARQPAGPTGHVVGQPGQVVDQRLLRGEATGDPLDRGARHRGRAHGAGRADWPSSMSAMTARMNSSASSVMPPATPP